MSRAAFAALLGLVAAVFLGLRCYVAALPHSFHYDETWTLYAARWPWGPFFRELLPEVTWPPLGYALYKLIVQATGFSLLGLRAATIALACGVFALLGWFLHRRFGAQACLLGLGLLAVSPVHIMYDVWGRPYPIFVAEILVLVLAAFEWLDRAARGSAPAFAVAGLAMLYTHHWGALLLAACGLTLAAAFLRRRAWRSLGGLAAIALIWTLAYLPYLPTFLHQAEVGQRQEMATFFRPLTGPEHLYLPWLWLGGSRLSGALMLGLAGLAAVLRPAWTTSERRLLALGGGTIALATLAGLAYSAWVTPIYAPARQSLYVNAVFIALVAVLAGAPRRALKLAAAAVLAVLLANSLRIVIESRPAFAREPVEQRLEQALDAVVGPGHHVYMVDVYLRDSFFVLHRRMDREHRLREFACFVPAWRERYVARFAPQDLRTGDVLLVVARGSEWVARLLADWGPEGPSAEAAAPQVADPDFELIWLRRAK